MAERLFNAAWREKAVLANGRRVVLRLLRPEDAPLLAAGFEKLSPESVYRRFHAARGRLSPDELRSLTALDDENHLAIGALDARTGEGLGVGRFIRLPAERKVAEGAFTVVDSAQRKGLGRLLLLRIAAAAKERGVEWLRCRVLASNAPMLELLKGLSLPLRPTRDGYVLQLDVPLAELDVDVSARRRGHALHNLFVAVATWALLVADVAESMAHWIARHSHPRIGGAGSAPSSTGMTLSERPRRDEPRPSTERHEP